MESLIAVGIGICIGFSPVGRIPAVKLFIKAITGLELLEYLSSLIRNQSKVKIQEILLH